MGDYQITRADGSRIGRVIKIAGEPPSSRWIAFAPHPTDHHKNGPRKGFPTRKAAVLWLALLAKKESSNA